MNNSQIFKKSIGSDIENGPRVYVTYAAYGYPEEIEKRIHCEAERFWERVKEILEDSAGKNPTE